MERRRCIAWPCDWLVLIPRDANVGRTRGNRIVVGFGGCPNPRENRVVIYSARSVGRQSKRARNGQIMPPPACGSRFIGNLRGKIRPSLCLERLRYEGINIRIFSASVRPSQAFMLEHVSFFPCRMGLEFSSLMRLHCFRPSSNHQSTDITNLFHPLI